MLIMGKRTYDYILVRFWITIWIQDFFEGFLPCVHPRMHHGADTDVMRGCTGFYTYVALLSHALPSCFAEVCALRMLF